MRIRNCIAACVVTLFVALAAAQSSRPLSLPDAKRWQQLRGQADDFLAKGDFAQAERLSREALAAVQRSLAASGFATGGRTYSRAHPFFWAPFVLVGD